MSFLSDEHVIEINDQQEMVGILGRNDEFLRLIDASFDATVMARGNKIIFSGSEEETRNWSNCSRNCCSFTGRGCRLPATTCVTVFTWYRVAQWQNCIICMPKR